MRSLRAAPRRSSAGRRQGMTVRRGAGQAGDPIADSHVVTALPATDRRVLAAREADRAAGRAVPVDLAVARGAPAAARASPRESRS